ncbi:MAG: NosD domain-containing protein [Candidatus Sifarchaeia archaeon]
MYERKAVLCLSLVVVFVLIFGIVVIESNREYILAKDPRIQSVSAFKDAQVAFSPIFIDDDAGFQVLGFPGEGSEEKPYIIADLVIEASTVNLIHIQDTTAYFEIRNCELNGIEKNHYGIYLLNVQNGKVIDNVIQNCWIGIFLDYSDDNHLETNLCECNGYSGIYLQTSSRNVLIQNSCNHNAIEGISVTEDSNYNVLEMNSASENSYFGIAVDDSAFNQLTGNEVVDCPTGFGLWNGRNNYLSENTYELHSQDPSVREGIGFHLTYCSNSHLSRNQATVSISVTSSEVIFIAGYDLEDCTYATLADNTIDIAENINGEGWSHVYGFIILRSDDNTLSANSVSLDFQGDMAAHYYGMNLHYSDRNVLSQNDISISADNPSTGFLGNCMHFVECEYNTVSGNSVVYGGTGHVYGIHLYWCDYSDLFDNTATECEQGIGLVDCVGNVVSGNIIDDCASWGINIIRCEHVTVTENMVTQCEIGIRLVNTDHSTISDNQVAECLMGVHLTNGQNNQLRGNTIEFLFYDSSIDPSVTIFGVHVSSCPNTVLSENQIQIHIYVPLGIIRDIHVSGVYLIHCSYAAITANIIDISVVNFGEGSSDPYGFFLLNCHENDLTENIVTLEFRGDVYGYYKGIHLESTHRNTVSENDITISAVDPPDDFEAFCIRLVWSEYNALSENTLFYDSTGYGLGIYLHWSSHNEIFSNTASQCEIGIGLLDCEDNAISGNTIDVCMVHGIDLVGCINIAITDNNVMHCLFGYWSMDSSHNTLTDNTFRKCHWGLYLDLSSCNLIFHNNIIDNFIQAVDCNSVCGNYWYHPELLEGNYWSDYPGKDDGSGEGKHEIAGDMIGDTEIPWPGICFDEYPFVVENGWNLVDAILYLIGEVEGLVNSGVLNEGIGQSLTVKLEEALALIHAEMYTPALELIGSFINQVISLENARKLTNDEAQYLINLANLVIELIVQSITQP